MSASARGRFLGGCTIGLVLGLGLVAVAPFGLTAARAAAYCNLYPPSRVAIWTKIQTFTYTFGAGCEVSGAKVATWRAAFPDMGEDLYVVQAAWKRGGPSTGTGEVWHWGRLGRVQWAAVDGDSEVAQNEASTVIKFGAVSYIAARRVGGYHEVISRGYHYTPGSDVGGVVPSGGRPGQLQFREPGSSTWRPVGGIRLERDGRSIVRTWSPGPRFYRVSFGEQPTLFDTISAEVEAR